MSPDPNRSRFVAFYLAIYGDVQRDELRRFVGVTERTFRRYLREQLDRGNIELVEGDRYRLKPDAPIRAQWPSLAALPIFKRWPP